MGDVRVAGGDCQARRRPRGIVPGLCDDRRQPLHFTTNTMSTLAAIPTRAASLIRRLMLSVSPKHTGNLVRRDAHADDPGQRLAAPGPPVTMTEEQWQQHLQANKSILTSFFGAKGLGALWRILGPLAPLAAQPTMDLYRSISQAEWKQMQYSGKFASAGTMEGNGLPKHLAMRESGGPSWGTTSSSDSTYRFRRWRPGFVPLDWTGSGRRDGPRSRSSRSSGATSNVSHERGEI
jgi:hypothetical protein